VAPFAFTGSVNNDFCLQNTGNAGLCNNQPVLVRNTGNPLLKSERAQTTEVGIVWQPGFIPNFQASVDYYRIGLKGAINPLPVSPVTLCFLGATQGLTGAQIFCQQNVIATANGHNISLAEDGRTGSPNAITALAIKAFNFAALTTDGFDLEASYSFDLQDYK